MNDSIYPVIMRNIRTVAFVLLAFTTSSCSEDIPDVEVSLSGSGEVKIQTINDEATIKDVVVNRGNCKVGFLNRSTNKIEEHMEEVTIKFGETFSPFMIIGCDTNNIREVEVTTSEGEFLFTWS